MLEKLLAKRHIRNLDLSSLRAKLMETQGWSSEHAEEVEGGYKRFLYALAHKEPEDMLSPPSQEIDEFWHQHILDTRKYREDCNAVFGHYIDHTPGLAPGPQRRADMRRAQIYDDYDIDSIDFSSDDSRNHSSGFFAGGDSGHSHSSHGDHGCSDAGSAHGGDGGHGCDSGGDGGGGDGGGSCGGGGCGGGGCGGG
jgi:hypothetical protein